MVRLAITMFIVFNEAQRRSGGMIQGRRMLSRCSSSARSGFHHGRKKEERDLTTARFHHVQSPVFSSPNLSLSELNKN